MIPCAAMEGQFNDQTETLLRPKKWSPDGSEDQSWMITARPGLMTTRPGRQVEHAFYTRQAEDHVRTRMRILTKFGVFLHPAPGGPGRPVHYLDTFSRQRIANPVRFGPVTRRPRIDPGLHEAINAGIFIGIRALFPILRRLG